MTWNTEATGFSLSSEVIVQKCGAMTSPSSLAKWADRGSSVWNAPVRPSGSSCELCLPQVRGSWAAQSVRERTSSRKHLRRFLKAGTGEEAKDAPGAGLSLLSRSAEALGVPPGRGIQRPRVFQVCVFIPLELQARVTV